MNKPRTLPLILSVSAVILWACAAPASPTAVAISTFPVPPEPAATGEPVHLKVGTLGYMSNGPVFIAQDEGLFAEQGLEVELIDFGFTERDMVAASMQGQIDAMTVAMSVAVLSGIEQGANARYVADKGFANPEACASDGFLARKELLEAGTLEDLSNLRGMTIVSRTGNIIEYVTDKLLERAALSMEDMQPEPIVDPAVYVEGMGAGTVDLAPVGEPWITRARLGGAADLWLPYSDLIPNTSVAGIVFGPSMLERPDDVGVRFMVAYLRAVDRFQNDRSDRIVEIISEHTGLPAEEIEQVCWNSIHPDGKIDTDGLAGFLSWATAKGYTEAALGVDQVWDGRFVEQAYPLVTP
jgi:NitT/TauT family transport system substrate-binding protein